MTNSTSSATTPVVPSEVGWQFVPQYYTFVNKQPNRLHCFYTKASTFIHGTEGEDGKPCFGQQEIHNKITSIGFQDCKVFIHSVDAQASAAGGIIIQVIGEMSNHGDPWRKFVQTFFLAEQPNGYFVLNDIFRFLKEETADSEEGDPESESASAPAPVQEPVPTASPTPVPVPETAPETAREPSPSPPPVPAVAAPTPVVAPPPPTEEPPTTDVPEVPTIIQTPTPAPEPPAPVVDQPNGIHNTESDTLTPAPVAEESPAPEPIPLPAAPAPVAATPPPTTTPPNAAAPQAPAPALAPSPPVPSGPRSWASLAATNSKKWGSAVAQESRGVTETPVTPVSSGTQTPPTGGPGPRGPPHHHHHQHHHQHQHGPGSTPHPAYLAAQSITIAQCFVKGVTEPISDQALTTVLTQRFGPIKGLDVVRPKACAFLEFTSLDAAKRAIIASLPVPQGGEGGIWIDVGGELGNLRISVETKKERGDRPVSRPRGGAPPVLNGEGGGRGAGGGSYTRGGGGGGGGGGGARGGQGGGGGRGRGGGAGHMTQK